VRRLFAFVALLIVIGFFISPAKVSAEEAIQSFDVQVIAKKSGDLLIQERILYTFGDSYRHGIYRTIPLISRVGDLYRVIDLRLTGVTRDGKKEKYSLNSTGSEITVKIGNPDRTITGPHLYEIDYKVKNAIGSNYEDHDEIYWNVTGDRWEVPIASASVSLSTDFGVNSPKAICFTGVSGSKESNCTVLHQSEEVDVVTNSLLSESEGLTIVASYPVGTFPKSTLQKSIPMDPDFKLFLIIYGLVFILLNFVLTLCLIYWYLKKKHKNKFGPPAVNFDLPKAPDGTRISPAEAGTIDNTKFDKDDIIATIYDLAIRKYIKIEGTIKKINLGLTEKQDFTLNRLDKKDDLNTFESYLLDKLFNGKMKTSIKDAKLTYTTFSTLETTNFATLIKRNFFTKNPKSQKSTCIVFGVMSFFAGFWILAFMLFYLYKKLDGRTELGVEMDWKMDGLKIFLKATKRYDVWQTKNFVFLESMIPYAMAFGVIDDYMKELKNLKPEYKPNWYSGNGNFYAMYPLFSSSASSNVTTSAPSSSSGFSGGSSGGGGGGGGGGSW